MQYVLGILGAIVTILFSLWRSAVSKGKKSEARAEASEAREGDAVLKHQVDKIDSNLNNRPGIDSTKKSDEELADYFNKKKK